MKAFIRRCRKNRPIVWLIRHGEAMQRFFRMAYSGDMSQEWTSRRKAQLDRLLLVKSLNV